MSRTRLWLAAATGALVLAPQTIALACPMCIASNEANRDAFLGTTVLLSLLPLAMFGGFLAWVLHRSTAAEPAPEPRPVDPAQSTDAD